jgi:hypothetical protein
MGGQGKIYLGLGMILSLWSVYGLWGLALGIAANLFIWWILTR